MANESNIAIIIVLFNPSSVELENVRHISSVYKGVIVDNSSVSHFSDRVNKMRYIGLGENTGIAEAQNIGVNNVLEDSEIEYVFYFDQDSIFADDYPLKMVEEYEHIIGQDIKIAALGPTVIQKKTEKEYKSVIHKDKIVNSHFILRREIIASGCCISRSVIESVGRNDSSLFIDFIDFEWCWRARYKGFVCGITPNVKIWHEVGMSHLSVWKYEVILSAPMRYYYQYRNYLWLCRRKYVPFQWKFAMGVKLFMRLLYLPMVMPEGRNSRGYMLKGIKAGLKN